MEKVKYTTSSRFYDKASGELYFVQSDVFSFANLATHEAQFYLGEYSDMLNPCNISVRGKGGRFVKWRNK